MKYVKKSNTEQKVVYEIASITGATAATAAKYHLEVINTSTGSKTIYPATATTSTGDAATGGAANTHFRFIVAFPNSGAYVVSLISSDVSDMDLKSELTTLNIDTVYAVTLSGIYSAGSSSISF